MPPSDTEARARLNSSPRHGEWVMIGTPVDSAMGLFAGDSVRAWIVYPERPDKAPVVLVIHGWRGLTPWIRAVADQVAADGFVAIAPDFMTSKKLPGSPEDGPPPDLANQAIQNVGRLTLHYQVRAVAQYGMSLPASTRKYGLVGFDWGGTRAFEHALNEPGLGAAVVYYSETLDGGDYSRVQAPILGLFGGDGGMENASIQTGVLGMIGAGKSYETHLFPGARHGFLRVQGQNSDSASATANLAASRAAWGLTIEFLRKHLGS